MLNDAIQGQNVLGISLFDERATTKPFTHNLTL